MERSLTIFLLLSTACVTTALKLKYLDPVKLQTVSPSQVQKQAALDIIKKYTAFPEQVNVEIDIIWFKNNKDTFTVKTLRNKLHISASSGVAAVWGFNYYLKKYLKGQIEWQTMNIQWPEDLPDANEHVIANDRFRYYQNVCTASYSFVWWSVEDWMKHLEWMALNGINLALAPVAQEAAWLRVYQQIGMTQEEIDDHFTGPAFLSWLRMGNVHGWGGPLPNSWHNLQANIQASVISKMLQLGMVPVLPAFNGHVPVAFSRVFPKSVFYKVSQWEYFDSQYSSNLFVEPKDPVFKMIGKMFLNEIKTVGVHIYTADPFNEVTVSNFSTMFSNDTAQAIFETLSDFDNEAVWLLQNWMFVNKPSMWPQDRVQTFLNSVPNGRMLILDLQSEQWPQYDRYKMYYGQPFIWCMLHNFGGTLGMFGNMVTINRDVYKARSQTDSTMIGIGLTPEGINQNYVVYDLMLESAWRKSPVQDLNAWAADYAERRYGCNETAEAWKYLLKSVYSFNGSDRVMGQYVVTQQPSFDISPWAWYKSYDLFQAVRKLVHADESKCNTEGYQYDIVDVTRQALQYRAAQLYVNIRNVRTSNNFIFESAIQRFLAALDDMVSILQESPHFIASKWYERARSLGQGEDESYLYEMNARNQITLWGPKGEISDYACKQWAEVVQYYYRPRWSTFLTAALQSKRSGEIFDERGTKRVVTATVEIPYTTMSNRRQQSLSYGTSISSLKAMAKNIYRKWVYVADLHDLPLRTTTEGSHTAEVNTMNLVENGTTRLNTGPSVIILTTPTN